MKMNERHLTSSSETSKEISSIEISKKISSIETPQKISEQIKNEIDKQAEDALRDLEKLSPEDRKKLGEKLDEKVSALLNQIGITPEKISEKYKNLITQEERDNLEAVFELANLKNHLEQAQQREINAMIDLTKSGLDQLNFQVLSRVSELYNQREYQQAIDIAVILASKGSVELREESYATIKQILKVTPPEVDLKIIDKDISFSDRIKWIKKMEQNIIDLQSKNDTSRYYDGAVKQKFPFELDSIKVDNEISEKKALKKASKELQKILKKLNDASALSFIEEKYSDIRSMHDVESSLTKDYLLKNGYLPKSGKEIKDSELQAIKNLFYYKWNYTEDVGKKNQAENQAYEQIKITKIAGVSMAEVHKAKEIMDQVSTSPHEAIKVLLGDNNRDGKLTNAISEQGERRENVDQGTFFGGQIAQMYENAIARYGEEKVVENIMKVIQNLHGLSEFKVFSLTENALVDAFKASPAALVAFRKKLTSEGDSGMSMLYAGTEYAKMRIDEIKSEETRKNEAEKVAKAYFEKPQNFDTLESFDFQVKEKQKADLDQVRKNLEKIKNSDTFNNLNSEQKAEIENLLAALSVEKLEFLLNSQQMKEARKGLIISGVGAALSAVAYQGEWNLGAGAGAALTHEKINEVIAKSKVFDSLNAGTGLYMDASGFSLGLGLSLNGARELGKETRMFYSLGAGTNLLQPKGVGVNAVLGTEKLLNKADLEASLDKKSAKYLGVVGAAGVGIDLSSVEFDSSVLSLALQGYWRQDKLEGIERQTKSLQEKVKPIFEELLGKASSVEAIAQTLQKKFPKTRGDTIYETAVGLYNTIKSYEQGGQDVKDQLSSDFAQYLAQNWRNENIEEVVKEGWHISQLGVGANVSLAKLFTGFFGIGSLAATKYTDAKYIENKEMLDKAVDGMNDIHNFEQITNKEKTLAGKLKIINTLLRTENLLQEKPLSGTEKNYISLSPSVFDAKTSVRVMCAPELAPYMHYKDGELQLPFNADISVGKILHQGRETRVLILGKKSLTGTKEISLNADKVEFTEKVAKPEASQDSRKQQAFEFGTQPLDAYNLIEKTVSKETPVQLDGKPSDELVTYLEQNGGILVDFRHGNGYKKFMTKMASWDRNSESLDTVKSLLPSELQKQVTTVDDVRFVFASLSRVSQTRDKQLEHSDLAKKANEYLKAAGLQNNEGLKNYIEKVGRGSALDDAEWAKMKQLLKIPNGWHYYNIDTPAGKLFHMLTPVKKLAEARTSSYTDKITKEYKQHTEGSALLLEARAQALKKLQGKVTAKGTLEQGWIGAVAGYESADHIDDKFVGAPKMIEGSMVDITGVGLEAVKRQYLTDLASADKAQFDHIKAQILAQIDAKDTSAGANALRNAKDNNADFIDFMLTAQTTNDKGEKVQLVNFDMKYGFFADCVNETLLLGNLKVQTTSVEQKPAEGDVYYYDAVVTNDAVTRAKTVGMGVVAGRVSDRVKDDSGTDPTKKTLEDKSETDPTKKTQVTPDELQKMIDNGQLKEVNGQTILVNGEHYNYIIDSEEGLLLYGGSKNIPADKAIPAYALKENNGKVAFNIGKYVPQEVPTPVESLPPLTKEIADAKKEVSSSFATQASAQTVHMNYTAKK